VIRKLHALSYTGPITIERETSGTQQEADIRASIAFLEHLIVSSYA
jgi:sugar phosphate isomerase/epimerase